VLGAVGAMDRVDAGNTGKVATFAAGNVELAGTAAPLGIVNPPLGAEATGAAPLTGGIVNPVAGSADVDATGDVGGTCVRGAEAGAVAIGAAAICDGAADAGITLALAAGGVEPGKGYPGTAA
jgi:hypothetical protein